MKKISFPSWLHPTSHYIYTNSNYCKLIHKTTINVQQIINALIMILFLELSGLLLGNGFVDNIFPVDLLHHNLTLAVINWTS